MPNSTFAERLAAAMKEANITQSNLAVLIGSTQPAVSQWCRGKKTPSPSRIDEIAKELGVEPEWLSAGVGPDKQLNPETERADFQSQSVWGFRRAPADGGRDFGNSNVWTFDPQIGTLVREVLQNASDAALPGGGVVRTTFRIIELEGDDLEAYKSAFKWSQLQAHLRASTENQQKLGRLIEDGLRHIDETGKLLLLIIDDSGTTGLLGPESGDGKFAALCRNNLDSNKEGAVTKGGAFGLGKGVLWRASRFATVVFCSNLSDPTDGGQQNQRLIGRCDLPWHECDGNPFAGVGWFGRAKNSDPHTAVSFWENTILAHDLYLSREGSGTSACVVGFHDPSSDTNPSARELAGMIEEAAAKHFFPAITFGRLAVSVETYNGRKQYDDKSPSSSLEVDVSRLQPEFHQILLSYREGSLTEELTTVGDVVCRQVRLQVPKRRVKPKHDECTHEAVLLVRQAPDETDEGGTTPNRMAIFRGPGMVVLEKNLNGICLGCRPFHALLLCGAAASDNQNHEEADEFLRTAEPPSHNDWKATPELKALYARGCVGKLTDFFSDAKDLLREIVKPLSRDLGDGPNSLRELFRIGNETITVTRDRPRIVGQPQGKVVDGKWHVEAQIRLKPTDHEMAVKPALSFVAETGGGQAVTWESLESVSNCTVEGQLLRIPARKRDVRFRGITDLKSHPVPANESSVVVEVRDAFKIGVSS